MSSYDLLTNVSNYLPLIAFFIFIKRFKQLDKKLMLLGILISIGLFVDISTRILLNYGSNINDVNYIFHFYTIIEFALLAWIYQIHFKGFYPKYLLPSLILIFTTIALYISFFAIKFIKH